YATLTEIGDGINPNFAADCTFKEAIMGIGKNYYSPSLAKDAMGLGKNHEFPAALKIHHPLILD
ncbi:MAG: hypothetical protein M1438_04775, partial [Deltaproteobacteria bacterium]|nr:hypothetical protein [Deltaproteobacteria bacterium]